MKTNRYQIINVIALPSGMIQGLAHLGFGVYHRLTMPITHDSLMERPDVVDYIRITVYRAVAAGKIVTIEVEPAVDSGDDVLRNVFIGSMNFSTKVAARLELPALPMLNLEEKAKKSPPMSVKAKKKKLRK